VLVKSKKVIFLRLILFKLLLKLVRIASRFDIGRTAINAFTILRHKLINVDVALMIFNVTSKVLFAAVLASVPVFFDVNQDIIRK